MLDIAFKIEMCQKDITFYLRHHVIMNLTSLFSNLALQRARTHFN